MKIRKIVVGSLFSLGLSVTQAIAGVCYQGDYEVKLMAAVLDLSPPIVSNGSDVTISWDSVSSQIVGLNIFIADSSFNNAPPQLVTNLADPSHGPYTETISLPSGTWTKFYLANVNESTITNLKIESDDCTVAPQNSNSQQSSSSGPGSVIRSDIERVNRSAVAANNSMVAQGLDRFVRDRKPDGSLVNAAVSTSGPNRFALDPEVRASNGTVLGGVSFFGQYRAAGGAYRRVTFGEFGIQRERGSGTTLSFNGRTAWEHNVSSDAVVAYFVGAEVNRSNIEGSYSGDQKRYGITAGIYGFKALEDNIYLSGYGAFGVARSNLDITDSASSNVQGDYISRTLSLGGQVSGLVGYESFELRPSVTLNYAKTWVGDIVLNDSGSPISVSVGDTKFAELIASPEFRFPLEQKGVGNIVTIASAAPRFMCELNQVTGLTTRECGAGLELGVSRATKNGAFNLNAKIRLDRVGGLYRQGMNLQVEYRF